MKRTFGNGLQNQNPKSQPNSVPSLESVKEIAVNRSLYESPGKKTFTESLMNKAPELQVISVAEGDELM